MYLVNVDSSASLPLLQKKGKTDAAEQVGKAHARAGELEKQVRHGVIFCIICSENCILHLLSTYLSLHVQIDKLKKDLDLQQKEKGSLESRVDETENKMLELNSKLGKVSLFLVFDGFMTSADLII